MKLFFTKIAIICGIFSLFLTLSTSKIYTQAEKADNTKVSIEIKRNSCILNAVVKPEKRLPEINNWSTMVTLEILDLSNRPIGVLVGRSNNTGLVTFDNCKKPVPLVDKSYYNIYVRGLSHLKKYYPNFQLQIGSGVKNDFSTNNKILLAGETSAIFDNYINSLDLSTQAKNFRRTDDEKNDLNRDNIVNALDISNTAFNFRKPGD